MPLTANNSVKARISTFFIRGIFSVMLVFCYLLIWFRTKQFLFQTIMFKNLAKYDVKNVVAELNMAVFEGQVTETATAEFHKIGVMLFVNDGVTETPVNGTSYDSTSGGTGYVIQIHVLDGADAANVTIQHSANNSTWADLIAAADYDEYTATQLKSTVTSVNRYVRAVVAATDTANSVAIAMKVGY